MLNYFTPAIEDIHPGYQCEILWNQNMLPEEEWVKIKVQEDGTEEFDHIDWVGRIANSKLRTPYLTREQIEAEGWVYKREFRNVLEFERGNVWVPDGYSGFLTFWADTHRIKITTTDSGFNQDGPNHSVKFKGRCQCINQFRTISKMISL